MKYALKISVAILLLAATACATKILLAHWFDAPKREINACIDAHGLHKKFIPDELPAYQECVERRATLYLEKDYAESKDLGKTFLTLLSAMLVASITFSEKIVDVSKAELLPLSTMIVCWVLLLVAIISCGAGLAFMTTAAGIAAYQPELDYGEVAGRGVTLFLTAGVAFGFALVALIIAGVASLLEKRAASLSAPKPQ